MLGFAQHVHMLRWLQSLLIIQWSYPYNRKKKLANSKIRKHIYHIIKHPEEFLTAVWFFFPHHNLFSQPLHLTPVKLYQQTNNRANHQSTVSLSLVFFCNVLQIPEVVGGRVVFKQMSCGERSESGGPVGERLNNSKESCNCLRGEMFNRLRLFQLSLF